MAKKGKSWKESFVTYCSYIALPFLLASIVPYLSWRKSPVDPSWHARFPMSSVFTLLSMSDKTGILKPYAKWKREMCMTMQFYNAPDLASGLLSLGSTLASQVTGAPIPMPMLGCKNWQNCKDHTAVRCLGYEALLYLGIACLTFAIISIALSLATVCFLNSDMKVKKPQKKASAEMKTMIAAIAACLISFITEQTWVMMSDSTLRSFQSTAYYPVPPLFAGPYVMATGSFFQLIAAFFAVNRIYQLPCGGGGGGEADEEDGEDEQYAAAGQQYPNQGQPGFGAPPPPSMGQPGFAFDAPPPPSLGQPGFDTPAPPPP